MMIIHTRFMKVLQMRRDRDGCIIGELGIGDNERRPDGPLRGCTFLRGAMPDGVSST
jgi:hypothetical protein